MKKLFSVIFILCSIQIMAQPGMKPIQIDSSLYSQVWKNVNYAGDNFEYHNADIYLPAGKTGKHKVIIVIYGSAWMMNNAKDFAIASIGVPLLKSGFAVVTVNHRSSIDAPWPAQINDIKAAIRFVRGSADKYNIDNSFIGITGFSSGGHLSAFAAVTNNTKTVNSGELTIDIEGNIGNYLKISSNVDAVVDWFGPVDMSRMENCNAPKGAESPEALLIGKRDPKTNPDWVKVCSAVNYVDKKDIPIMIIHGDNDNVVPQCQSKYLKQAFDAAGVEAEFISVPGGEHGPGCFTDADRKSVV